MNVTVLSPRDLTDSQIDEWRRICAESPHLDSGYFAPEFTLDVAAVRDDVRVAAIRRDEQSAFWAFQQTGKVARPVGGRISDYQAIVAPAGFQVDPRDLLRQCGLQCYYFDHLVDSTGDFAPWTTEVDGSPYLDLREGFEAYRIANQSGSKEIKQTLRKRRKLEREAGPLEVRLFDDSQDAWESLLSWKSQQYQCSGITNVFSHEWTVQLLRRLAQRNDNEFRGMLSSLRVGGRLLAVHFGLLCRGNLHYWFPAYEPGELADRCSPGRVLLMELAMAADTLPLKKIDLGRGMSRYKTSAMSGFTKLSVGEADLRPVRRAVRGQWRRTKQWLKQSPLRRPLQWPAKAVYHMKEWLEFR